MGLRTQSVFSLAARRATIDRGELLTAAPVNFRKDAIPPEKVYADTIDEAVKKRIDEMLVAVEQSKQMAAKVDAKTSAAIMETVKQQEAQFRSLEFAKMLRTGIEMERAEKTQSASTSNRDAIARYPANPEEIFARRLREFLDATADVNFSARTIHLTGGPDGIEFVDPVDRKRSTTWQMAVIAGRDHGRARRRRGMAEGNRAMTALSRRQVLALLATVPLAARIGAQVRPGPKHRVVMSFGHGFLLEPGGALHAWHKVRQLDSRAIDALGLGDNRPLEPYTLVPVPSLTGVVKVAAGSSVSFAVLADGRLLSWGLNAGHGLLVILWSALVSLSLFVGYGQEVSVGGGFRLR